MEVYRRMLAALAVWLACGPADAAITATDALQFFDRYVKLGDAFDPALADLYRDESRIQARRKVGVGNDRLMDVTGAQWRPLVRNAMPAAKARGDSARFTNVRAEPQGERTRVRAERYSLLKCYTDKDFYVVIARDREGKLYIAEEFSETQANSSC